MKIGKIFSLLAIISVLIGASMITETQTQATVTFRIGGHQLNNRHEDVRVAGGEWKYGYNYIPYTYESVAVSAYSQFYHGTKYHYANVWTGSKGNAAGASARRWASKTINIAPWVYASWSYGL
ncbi:MAG: lactococcin 972 family bacteriocin [Streptococcaceae bacterium]|jgi:hypothetical protein|nr:lactococcin 972 family bacteriocin [Streptococcaceae bacterium]